MDLLGVLRGTAFRGTRSAFLVALGGAAARVQGSRLGYVLSTFVQLQDCSETVLQLWATDGDVVKWLLHVGVCPNMGFYNDGGSAQYRGWEGAHGTRAAHRERQRPCCRFGAIVLTPNSRTCSLHTGRTHFMGDATR
jgi:hypothetical protein